MTERWLVSKEGTSYDDGHNRHKNITLNSSPKEPSQFAVMNKSQIDSLIAAARSVHGEFNLGRFSAGSCAAAILSDSGHVFTGICIDLACGIGFCAEHSAIAEMLKNRQTHIVAAVAVTEDSIVPPCGRCRELMAQVDSRNLSASIILSSERVVTLSDLLPESWLS